MLAKYSMRTTFIISNLSEITDDSSQKTVQSKLNSLLKGVELHSLTKNFRDYRKAEKGKIQKDNANLFYQFLLLIEVYNDIMDIVGENWHKSPEVDQENTKYIPAGLRCATRAGSYASSPFDLINKKTSS